MRRFPYDRAPLGGQMGMNPVDPTTPSSPLERYFNAVDDGDFEAALGLFSAMCVYARPPLRSSDPAHRGRFEALVGRDAVRAFLETRGAIPLRHHIHTAMIDDDQCFVEGTSSRTGADDGDTTVFMAHAKLDGDGLISRFLALSTPIDAVARQIVVPPH